MSVIVMLLLMAGVEANPGPQQQQINLGLVNAWSIVNKTALIHDAIAEFNLSLLAITETFVYEDSPDVYKKDVAPDGFSVLHQHRQRKQGMMSTRGGGIALIHRNNIKVKVIKTDPDKFKSCEILLVRLANIAKGVTIAVIYRPPRGHIPDFVAEVNELICSGEMGNNFIICGDLNCPGPVNTKGLINDELKHMIEEQSLIQHVRVATCRTGNILDHILTPDNKKIVRDVNVHDIGLSDHSLITCKISQNMEQIAPTTAIFRCWKRLDLDRFKEMISSSSLYRCPATTADSFADQLKNESLQILNDLLPEHVITRRNGKFRSGWLSDEAVKAKQERRRLERRWKSTGYEAVRIAYRRACKVANKLICESRSAFYTRRVKESSSDPRMLWRTVKNILHTGRSGCSQVGLSGAFASYVKEKIEKVRTSVANCTSNASAVHSHGTKSTENLLRVLGETTIEEVSRIIKQLPNKTSPLDYVHTSVLKSCVDVFAPLITRLINLSFSEGCFPAQFKQAQVTPLIKKAGLDESDPASYRPISNLNTIGKIIERICLARILPHVASTGNFSPLQSAYRKKHSTETALLKILDDLYRVVDGKRAAVLIGLDLSAAFDTIDHDILIERLRSVFGFSELALAWVKSYLCSRTQFVKIGNEQSPTTSVDIGVPQGSVLGPFLFSVYVSPISDIITSFGIQYHQYADDTQLYAAVRSGADNESIRNLEACTCAVRDWFARNGMLLNPDKSEVLLIATPSVAETFAEGSGVAVAGSNITFSVKLKSLGVTLDRTLSFDEHVRNIVKASNFHIKALRHIRPLLDKSVANTIACSIVSTRIDYCNSLLYGTSKTNLVKLQRIQNSLCRVVAGTRRREHITPVLKNLHWLPVEQRIEYKVALITYKTLRNKQPEYLAELVTEHEPPRLLRSSSQHLVARTYNSRSKLGERSISAASQKVWNNLPPDLREVQSESVFKKKLKSCLFARSYCM